MMHASSTASFACIQTLMLIHVHVYCLACYIPLPLSVYVLCRFFDAHGNYYAKKDEESVEDTWLQDVDWNKVWLYCLCVRVCVCVYACVYTTVPYSGLFPQGEIFGQNVK